MRIANYLRPECVALHQRADSLEGAVQQLVALLDGTEDLTDTAAFAADVRARLALGGVCVGNGLAIPHAKSASVKRLQLAALPLDPPLACDTKKKKKNKAKRPPRISIRISAHTCASVRPRRPFAAPWPSARRRMTLQHRRPRPPMNRATGYWV